MTTVLLIIHLFIALGLVGLVLVQRSEGGALGIGGGGGGFMSGRGTANLLTRMTAVLAAAFFATSILLTIVARHGSAPTSIVNPGAPGQSGPSGAGGNDLPKLSPLAPPTPSGPQVPQ
jgi:preprotein translocase subunit SecG